MWLARDSAEFLDDEEEVHPGDPHEASGHMRCDRHDVASQAIQELLQLVLVSRHLDVESVNPVAHGLLSDQGPDVVVSERHWFPELSIRLGSVSSSEAKAISRHTSKKGEAIARPYRHLWLASAAVGDRRMRRQR